MFSIQLPAAAAQYVAPPTEEYVEMRSGDGEGDSSDVSAEYRGTALLVCCISVYVPLQALLLLVLPLPW